MTRLQVTPEDLITLAGRLSTIHDNMKGSVGGVDGGAAHQSVVDAVSHFGGKWDYSMGKISDAAGAAAGNLKSAAQGYENADNSLSPQDGGQAANG
ncbi:MAG TPA: hypothetical protein VKF59_06920 [Candidatus Dormibacteraeota bacterium]|nr:hypothetical protein [Candidatus Dormibacteraeota bacterium]